jgi:hypothetical protein
MNKICIISSLLIVTGFFISSCAPPPDLNKEVEALTALHLEEQNAHMEEETAKLVHMFDDTLTEVIHGVAYDYTRDQMTERLSTYFGNIEFVQREDAKSPVYNVSKNGTMAQVVIQKHLEIIVMKDSLPSRETMDITYAESWIKKAGEWKLRTVTSTVDEPVTPLQTVRQ